MPSPEDTEAVRLYWQRAKEEIQRRAQEQVPGVGPGGGLTQDQNAAAQKIKFQMYKSLPPALKEGLLKDARANLGLPVPGEAEAFLALHLAWASFGEG